MRKGGQAKSYSVRARAEEGNEEAGTKAGDIAVGKRIVASEKSMRSTRESTREICV